MSGLPPGWQGATGLPGLVPPPQVAPAPGTEPLPDDLRRGLGEPESLPVDPQAGRGSTVSTPIPEPGRGVGGPAGTITYNIGGEGPVAPPTGFAGATSKPVLPSVTVGDFTPAVPAPGERSQRLDGLAGEVAGRTKVRLGGALDGRHLGDAAQEYGEDKPVIDAETGKVITVKVKDKKTGAVTERPYDHVHEVDDATNGLESDITSLEKKLKHEKLVGKPRPEGSIADAEALLQKMKTLRDFIRSIVPRGARASWNRPVQ